MSHPNPYDLSAMRKFAANHNRQKCPICERAKWESFKKQLISSPAASMPQDATASDAARKEK